MSLADVFGSHRPETSQSAFKDKVSRCLNDHRIVGYFGRNLVQKDDVVNALLKDGAFAQAVQIKSYKPYAQARKMLKETIDENTDVADGGSFNVKTISVCVCALLLVIYLPVSFFLGPFASWGITLAVIVSAAPSAFVFGKAQIDTQHRIPLLASSFLGFLISLGLIILLPIYFTFSWVFIGVALPWIMVIIASYILHEAETAGQCKDILIYCMNQLLLPLHRRKVSRLKKNWLDDCVESIIIPNAVLAINTALGEDKDRLLVEQNSEGIRKLQDPSFTVSTSTERLIVSLLSQMDGGSIALAGPRGAGKSTLLRKFSSPIGYEALRKLSNPIDAVVIDAPVSVYLAAPAEYIPRDFIAELLQRLCETYLTNEHYRMPDPIYKERKRSLRRALGRIPAVVKFALGTVIALGIIAWMAWPIIGHVIRAHYHYHYYYISTTNSVRYWFDRTYTHVYKSIHNKFKSAWTFLKIFTRIFVVFCVWCYLANRSSLHERLGLRKEPPLAKTARDYLLRLQVEKTVTWGTSLNLNPVTGRLMGATLNKGGTASYTPWTVPELVGYTRRFMQDIANTYKDSTHAVIVGIDEIDRIGSLDHAERFIGEIKAIFGVERCFFLVAVAEDVGSVFAQRATAGRSILENAFDDILVVEPLNFEETRDLLLKRVPGFTDSFVYLSYALSGGLPRELIRVTRRLVEVNQDLGSIHRLADLAFILVKENILESIRATRSQISRLTLNDNWAAVFETLRSATTHLRVTSLSSMDGSRRVIEELSELKAPLRLTGQEANTAGQDEDSAKRIIHNFSAYAYFGLAVIDAFSDKFFDLSSVQQKMDSGSEGTYEELALARNELSVSPASSRAMLSRFRSSLSPRDAHNPPVNPLATSSHGLPISRV